MRTTDARRALAGLALAIGLPLATAGAAAAQSGPSGPTEPSGPSAPEPSGPAEACPSGPSGAEACETTTTTVATEVLGSGTSSGGVGGGGLARTGAEAALPLAAAAGAITVVLGGRRLAARLQD